MAASWLDSSLEEYLACKDPADLSWRRKRKGKQLERFSSTDGHGSTGNADSGEGDESEEGEDSSESDESEEGEDGEQREENEGIGPEWENDLLAQQHAEEEETTSEALLARIDLRAVECSDVGIRLSTPPFPFRQYWDSQYDTKKKRKAMVERRRRLLYYEDDEDDDEIKPQRKRLRASPDYTLGSFSRQ